MILLNQLNMYNKKKTVFAKSVQKYRVQKQMVLCAKQM